jgi:flagellar protein FlbD
MYSKDGTMIQLTRLNGTRFLINSDLIERVDETPDTVITLVDGTRYLVTENLETMLEEIRGHRATILAVANALTLERETYPGPDLKVVTLDKDR